MATLESTPDPSAGSSFLKYDTALRVGHVLVGIIFVGSWVQLAFAVSGFNDTGFVEDNLFLFGISTAPMTALFIITFVWVFLPKHEHMEMMMPWLILCLALAMIELVCAFLCITPEEADLQNDANSAFAGASQSQRDAFPTAAALLDGYISDLRFLGWTAAAVGSTMGLLLFISFDLRSLLLKEQATITASETAQSIHDQRVEQRAQEAERRKKQVASGDRSRDSVEAVEAGSLNRIARSVSMHDEAKLKQKFEEPKAIAAKHSQALARELSQDHTVDISSGKVANKSRSRESVQHNLAMAHRASVVKLTGALPGQIQQQQALEQLERAENSSRDDLAPKPPLTKKPSERSRRQSGRRRSAQSIVAGADKT